MSDSNYAKLLDLLKRASQYIRPLDPLRKEIEDAIAESEKE